MTTISVQFTDGTNTAIKSVFSCPQDPSVYDNLGEVSTSDSIYKTWWASLPPNVQEWWPAPD